MTGWLMSVTWVFWPPTMEAGPGTALDFHEDARALGLIVGDNTVAAQSDEKSMTYNLDDCSSAGLTLATGVFLAVLSLLPHWTSRAHYQE